MVVWMRGVEMKCKSRNKAFRLMKLELLLRRDILSLFCDLYAP